MSFSPFTLRSMIVADIPAVMELESQTNPNPWKEAGYRYEINHNELAHYTILEHAEIAGASASSDILGFCGFWLMADECHISYIAIAPKWQGIGLGELLLWQMQNNALALGAAIATLEVSASNKTARSLYRKYRFTKTGRRPGYYKKEGDDALIMTSPPLDADYVRFLAEKRSQLRNRLATMRLIDPVGVQLR